MKMLISEQWIESILFRSLYYIPFTVIFETFWLFWESIFATMSVLLDAVRMQS